jgi:hypothetical protein
MMILRTIENWGGGKKVQTHYEHVGKYMEQIGNKKIQKNIIPGPYLLSSNRNRF